MNIFYVFLALVSMPCMVVAFQDLNDGLLESIHNNDFLRVHHLLEQGADPNAHDKNNWSALLLATTKSETQVVMALVDAGADVGGVENGGWTALHFAADMGLMDIAAVLLQAGADPTLRNIEASTPMTLAGLKGHKEIVQLVEDFDYRELELIDAAAKGDVQRMERTFAAGPLYIDAQNEDGWTALIFSVDRGHREAARLLLKNGADVNIAEKTGWTALMFATYDKDFELVEMLKSFGASPQYLRRRTHHRL